MKTLIVVYKDRVRFLITNHPEYRFGKLCEQMPVQVQLFGVTDVKARDIKLRFATQAVRGSEWYRLTDEFQQFLSEIIQ
jgi:hypothetical protein